LETTVYELSKSQLNPSPKQLVFAAQAFLITIAVLSLPTILAAQACPEGNYGAAIRLFRALYPELVDRHVQLDFASHTRLDSDDFPRVFDLSISDLKPLPPAQDQTSEADRVGHLGVRFQFDAIDHRILSIFASGEYVGGEKHEKLNQVVDAHPEWSEAQMAEALLSTGAKFGPNEKTAIATRLPVSKLEPIVGKIQITSIEFTFRGNREAPHFAVMNWTIHFRTIAGKHHDEYSISIEPFGGKIVSLSRRRIN
jgi:hypothetical protein